MAMNMDTTFAFTNVQDNAPLNKRRRFAPASDFSFASLRDSAITENQTTDRPLLHQTFTQTPTRQEIESELLRVGMRIRKSVNDGYQTSQQPKFTPRPFFNMHRLSPATQAALCSEGVEVQPISTATFCGVNLAALSHVTSKPVEEQKMWSYATSHKRGYEGDSDSDDQEFMPQTPTLGDGRGIDALPTDYFSIDFDHMGEVSPMTQLGEPVASHASGRRMAKPKSRRPQPAALQEQSFNPFAQIQLPQQPLGGHWMGHRRITSCGIEANMAFGDFAEASFLQRREDLDMDCS